MNGTVQGPINENNVLDVISPVVDASFNSFKDFVTLQFVLRRFSY
jgi:hypothetical protein